MDASFTKQVNDEARRLFREGSVQVFLARATGPSDEEPRERVDQAVRLVYRPTGIHCTCEDFPSQIENYVGAAIRLKIARDKRPK